jgi:hypothetical protein
MEMLFYVLCLYGIIFGILLIVGLTKLATTPVSQKCKRVKLVLRIWWELFMSYLFAKQFDQKPIILEYQGGQPAPS